MGHSLWGRYGAILLVGCTFLLTLGLCYGHGHDHHHHHHDHDSHHHDESPSFKYSREANEAAIPKHPDTHGHDHGDVHSSPHHHHHHHDEHSGHHHGHHTHKSAKEAPGLKRSASEVWLSALASTLVISLVPFVILWFIPLDNSVEYQPLLKILLSFASGGLLGDAFLHLIPHALIAQQAQESGHGHHGHSHSHGHSHGEDGEPHSHDMSIGLWVLAGVLAFLVVEKIVRICKGPGHGHSHGPPKTKEVKVSDKKKEKSKEGEDSKKPQVGEQGEEDEKKETAEKKKPSKTALKGSPKSDKESEDSSKCPDSPSGKRVRFTGVDKIVALPSEPVEQIKVAGYLNLAADFAHNLTDGLAIGASFITGQGIGFMTTLTILFHEIPHEIGDFAILVQSGCSRRKAMFLQLITAVGAITGTLISLVADGMSETASPWILPFTAGGFIYIACVSVIPELLEETNLKQSILEIIAAAVGVLIMVFIAQYE